MGKLAELAGAAELHGKVCITDTKGATHEYPNEAAAEADWGDKASRLEHRRGAFFEREPEAPSEPPKKKKASKKHSGRSRTSD